MRILVTGGAGFIGSAVCRRLVGERGESVLNFDKLTYAANLASLAEIEASPLYSFRRGDVGDASAIAAALADFQPDVILHLAAESHVDRSIDGPAAFVETNIVGTFILLQQALGYCCLLYTSDAADALFLRKSAKLPRSWVRGLDA